MKILVTGGAGYIGSVVTHQLVEAGLRVTVLDDLSTGLATNIPDGAEFAKLSLHDVGQVLAPGAGFDAVMLAGECQAFWARGGQLAILQCLRCGRPTWRAVRTREPPDTPRTAGSRTSAR
jgi:nucleoside-diphosphate-sugar epimerase